MDGRGRGLGRADGLVLEVRAGAPPRVTAIEVGTPVLARRLGRWAERLALAVLRRWGPRYARPTRFPIDQVRTWDVDLVLDLSARDTEATRWEAWWSEHVIGRIPGGRSK